MAKDKIANEGADLTAQPGVVVNDTNPLPPVADVVPATLTPNQEDDQEAVDSGYLMGLEIDYFTQFNESDLKRKRYSDPDIVRIKRVLVLAGKELATESYFEKREQEKAASKGKPAVVAEPPSA